jgi:methionyl-tRNA formyltransferase
MIRVLIVGYGPMGLALTRGTRSVPDIAEIVGVFPWSSHPQERFLTQEPSENSFRWYLKHYHLPLVEAHSVNDYRFTRTLTRLQPDVVMVGSWGEIFKPHVLEIPGIRFINCHPSLLPMHRGANPYTAALLAGDAETGVTFHLMDPGIDTGPILLQGCLPIQPQDTGDSLRRRSAELAESMVPGLLQQVLEDRLSPVPQPDGGSYEKFDDEIGWVSWGDPPEEIQRKIRALYPWFDNWTRLDQHRVRFRYGRLIPRPKHLPSTDTGPGVVLERQAKGVLVSTMDPQQALLLDHLDFTDFPAILTPLLTRLWLKPGKRFSDRPASATLLASPKEKATDLDE